MATFPAATNRRSIEKYRHRAIRYDATCDRTAALRARTIARLGLAPGDVVLDAGCGTGLSFAALVAGVGDAGRVFGVDQSPEMIALARARAADWPQVTVIEGFGETVRLPSPCDALLFNYTHDILQSPRALANLLAQARPGARVAVAGIQYFPLWTGPLNLLPYLKNVGWNGRPGRLWRPWRRLASCLERFEREPTQWGMGYIGWGVLKDGSAGAGGTRNE